jgi:hypothetical protein
MITRSQKLSWSTNSPSKEYSCKQDFHNNPGKHTGNSILFIYLQKVFVGPHFCITKLTLNRVTKSGVLQPACMPPAQPPEQGPTHGPPAPPPWTKPRGLARSSCFGCLADGHAGRAWVASPPPAPWPFCRSQEDSRVHIF